MNNKSSVIFISFLLFWLLLAPTSAIIPDPTINGWIKNAISLFLIWYVRQDIAMMFNQEFRIYNILLLTYCAISIFSIYYNADTISNYSGTYITQDGEIELEGVTSVKSTLYSCIGLLTASLYVQRISGMTDMIVFLKTFYVLLLLVIIPTNIEAFTKPAEMGTMAQYLIGNKFTVGYYNLYLCAFYYFLHPYLDFQRNRFILFSIIIMMLIVSIYIQCGTMVLASLVFMFFALFAPYKFRINISSAKLIVVTLIVLGIGFFMFVSWILQYESFQFIINLLNKDITLTGRVGIFASIQQAFNISPWVGLGYGNSIIISYYFTGALNSQNGIIDLFIQVGFLGVFTFIALIYTCSKEVEQNRELRYPLVAFLITMIVISMVEIPFKHIFIFFLSFCFIEDEAYNEDEDEDEINEENIVLADE